MSRPFRKLSVVIPVYNEEHFIGEVIRRVEEAPLPPPLTELEIVVVDDHSTDRTGEIVRRLAEERGDLRLKLIVHERNRGKGAALRSGFAKTTGEIVLVQDADLEYNPKEYPGLLAPILEGDADVVYGSRFLGGPHRVLYFWHYVGNRIFTTLSNMLTNINLTDMETCFKVFRAEIIKQARLTSNRFGFEPEVTARMAQMKARIFEVPISYHGRTYEEGKKIGWRDGVAALWHIIKFNLLD